MIDQKHIKDVENKIQSLQIDLAEYKKHFQENPDELFYKNLIETTERFINDLKGTEKFYQYEKADENIKNYTGFLSSRFFV